MQKVPSMRDEFKYFYPSLRDFPQFSVRFLRIPAFFFCRICTRYEILSLSIKSANRFGQFKNLQYFCTCYLRNRGVAQLVQSAAVTLRRSSVRARSSLLIYTKHWAIRFVGFELTKRIFCCFFPQFFLSIFRSNLFASIPPAYPVKE